MNGYMVSGKKLQILLSTFNGELYLKEQLNSFAQTAKTLPYKVLIRDDGSTDGTKEILEKYSSEENVEVEYGENIGLNASYIWLAAHSDPTCDFFAISDQDNQWLENKTEAAVKALEGCDRPALFASCSVLTNCDLVPIGKTKIPPRGATFFNALVQNPYPGHTQVLNRSLMEIVRRYCPTEMVNFDWWIYLLATTFGEVVYSPEPTVNYRQHEKNTVGYSNSKLAVFAGRALKVLHGDGKLVSRQNMALLSCGGNELPEEYRNELKSFLRGQVSICARINYFFHGKAYRQSRLDSVIFRLVFLLGGYRF